MTFIFKFKKCNWSRLLHQLHALGTLSHHRHAMLLGPCMLIQYKITPMYRSITLSSYMVQNLCSHGMSNKSWYWAKSTWSILACVVCAWVRPLHAIHGEYVARERYCTLNYYFANFLFAIKWFDKPMWQMRLFLEVPTAWNYTQLIITHIVYKSLIRWWPCRSVGMMLNNKQHPLGVAVTHFIINKCSYNTPVLSLQIWAVVSAPKI